MNLKKLFTPYNLVLLAMLSAMSFILMLFDFPILFIAPNFYKMDFSELPVLIGVFSLGPVAGIIIEAIKILLHIVFRGTSTGYVGEFASFLMGCALAIPAGIVYMKNHTRKGALIGLIVGSICLVIVGILANYYIMLPLYSNFMPLEAIINAGAAIWPAVSSTFTFVLLIVGPFNLFKGVVLSIVTLLVYKPLSKLINTVRNRVEKQ